MKVLLYDLETAPNLVRSWGVYEQNAIEVVHDWYLLCFAYKWAHTKSVECISLTDFPLYKKEPTNDREVVKKLWELFDEADILIAHNGDQFDFKKARARFLVHGLPPHSPVALIDTKKLAKRGAGFDSNKLDELGRQLGLGRKESTGGWDLWRGCLDGDKKSWEKMRKYNKQDVVLLEQVWRRLSPYVPSQPNRNVYFDDLPPSCPRPACGGAMKKNGNRYSYTNNTRYQQYVCTKCGTYGRSGKVDGTLIR